MDLTESIAPKSDQLNADDLIAGPVTVTITEVKKGTAEQPVDVVLDEFGPGRPLKPSKSMRRVMVAAWGAEASVYVGRRLTIYREPTIKFGGQEVGGIRISHLSHIEKPFTVALTVAKGKRQPFKVDKLPNAPTNSAPEPMTAATDATLSDLFISKGIGEADQLRGVNHYTGQNYDSLSKVGEADALTVIERLKERPDVEPSE